MANKKVSQLTSKPSVLTTDLLPIADPSTGQLFKTTVSSLGAVIGSAVASVNGLVGVVVLDTDDIQELASPTNRWFTDTRARAALSAGTGISYNSGTGVITNAVTSGQITTALGYTPANDSLVVKLSGNQTISGNLTATSFIKAGGTSSQFLMADGSVSTTIAFNYPGAGIVTSTGTAWGTSITDNSTNWNTAFSSRISSLTTNNSSGSATLLSNVLNIPTYTLAGLGGQPAFASGTGFVKISGTTISYLDETYLTTSAASSTYLTIANAAAQYQPIGTYVLGSGTGSRLARWLDGSTIAVAQIWDDGTNIGIGGAPGAFKLDVTGTLRVTGAATFSSSVTASSFAIPSGSSTGFLKANGSVDLNTYLTTTSAAAQYQPIGTYVAGSGSSSRLARWISSSDLSVAQIWDDGTNIGIGQAPGSFKLDVTGTARVTGAATFSNSITAADIFSTDGTRINFFGVGTSANCGFIGTTTNHDLRFLTNNTTKLTIQAGGNVGIGTTAPGTKLHIYEPLTNTSNYLIVENNRSRNAAIRLKTTVGDYYLGTGIGADVNQFQIFDGNAGENRLTISSSGDASFSNAVTSRAFGIREASAGRGGFYPYNIISGAGTDYSIGLFSESSLWFAVGGSITKNLVITSGGKVGIGTTAPGAKLEIVDTGGSQLLIGFGTVGANYYDATNHYFRGTSGSSSSGGSISCTSSVTATSFFESSDKTIKTLIQDNYQAKGIETVTAKLYLKNGVEELGYFAQDVQAILPSAVNKGADGLLNLSYREVHTAKIARLEKRVEELEAQLNIL